MGAFIASKMDSEPIVEQRIFVSVILTYCHASLFSVSSALNHAEKPSPMHIHARRALASEILPNIAVQDTMDNIACEKSCDYLHRIYTEKPGVCPKVKNQSNYVRFQRSSTKCTFSLHLHCLLQECSALCHLDGDCPETAKCCSYGCNRQCAPPRGRDPRLLPIPGSISVQERKRKRSIIIRWVMQKLTREQNTANSNLYVVQWRWGLHSEGESMTEWQTVTVRNKPYAILKHLLSPGRYYQFRVGAVSVHGSLGFSQPSQPFKLSKVILPSHTTQSELSGLFPNSVYIVEIHASVDSTEGELHGEKGIIFVRTMNATMSEIAKEAPIDETGFDLIIPTTSDEDDVTNDDNNIDVQTPFFDGELQTTANWINSRVCSPEKKTFIVTAKRGTCREYQLNQHSDTTIHEVRVNECSAVVRGLTFDCDYSLEIAEEGDDKAIISTTFSTKSCDATSAHGPLPCLSLVTPVFCIVHATVSCHWVRDGGLSTETVIGYRTSLSSLVRDEMNITILPPQVREIHYENLLPSTTYTLQIQPITNRGMGKALTTNFVTHAKILDENIIERFPGGEIIELPLEASSISLLRFSVFFLLIVPVALL
ncbi:WAP-type 'four-disulfide core [Necator americanus]|uniref:WAP-type 'four-disulfide core n=1 Tax=Necator americanus TaxID=51031 RepID=W2TXC8_NECAM|nr:WAP-type 'four-disulfide core [Necator americanus]ETN86493.1 WAP-type 'four-disulfide core [Necator americanus]